MHPYIHNLAQQGPSWALPPSPSDASWEIAFDDGSAEQRRNIANHWLWCLNASLPHLDNYKKIAWLAPYAHMYAKCGRYADRDLFPNAVFKGSLDDVIDLERAKMSWIRNAYEFIGALKSCWFEEPDNLEKYQAIVSLIENANKSARSAMQSYYPILQTLLWQHVQTNTEQQEQWLKLAVKISIQCGFDKVPHENKLFVCQIDQRAHAWHCLAYSANAGTKQTRSQQLELPVVSIIKAMPTRLKIETMATILNNLSADDVSGQAVLLANTIMNPTEAPTNNVYHAMRAFVPEYVSLWDVAENLDLKYTTVFEKALSIDYPGEREISSLPVDLHL